MGVAFLMLGFLVGNITGLSGSPIALALVPAIFALAGGSVLAFLTSISEGDRKVASRAILLFSAGCLGGIYLGIIVTTHQLLGHAVPTQTQAATEQSVQAPHSPESRQEQPNKAHEASSAAPAPELADRHLVNVTHIDRTQPRVAEPQTNYLRSELGSAADAVDQQVRNGTLSSEQGYQRLIDLIRGRHR
jgi:hypothetical protein